MTHIAVLKEEILKWFEPLHLTTFFDGTLGLGGHAEALLEAHPEIEKYVGFDQDRNALKMAQEKLSRWKEKCVFKHANFSELKEFINEHHFEGFDGGLLDLGMSSMQVDKAERGFSFLRSGPLDMRMNQEAELTAEEIVNEWNEKELGNLLKEYGEEKNWKKIARALVDARHLKDFKSTKDLADFIDQLKGGKRGKIHPATLTFQALRIKVNNELGHLENFLRGISSFLNIKGRMAIISFHRLEDRLVKNFFKASGLTILTKKPVVPSLAECRKNPRSRSAKLRVVEKDE